MSEQAEKAAWKARSDQAMDELFPLVYEDPALAKRLFQRAVDEPTLRGRLLIEAEIQRLKVRKS